MHVAVGEPADVVGRETLTGRRGVRAEHLDLAHVAHVEEPGGGADRAMLLHDAAVGDRHLPAAELDELGVEAAVVLVEAASASAETQTVRRSCGLPGVAVAAATVLMSSIATVMGPTPPGTGVIHAARSRALAKSTSPTSLPLASRLMPTSITIAPSLDPIAEDHPWTADRRDHDVGAPHDRRQVAGARVTHRHGRVLLEEEQAHGLPDQETPADDDRVGAGEGATEFPARRRMIPSGVQGRRPGTPASNRPWLIAVRPSTSFPGAIAWMTASLSMPLGSGSWTRMPWTSLPRVQSLHHADQLRGGRVAGHALPDRSHADLDAGALLRADVDARRRIVADEHRRQSGHDAAGAQRVDGSGRLRSHRLRHRLAVEDRAHGLRVRCAPSSSARSKRVGIRAAIDRPGASGAAR